MYGSRKACAGRYALQAGMVGAANVDRMIELTCHGAAGEVTGSCHLLTVGTHRLLLDCGLFQGSREDEARNGLPFPFDPGDIDAVVLSHAHLDHCGRLPLLVRGGFRGPILCHPATIDLLRVLLKDAAWLEAGETERENRRRRAAGKATVEPLFVLADVEAVMRRVQPLAFDQEEEVLPGVMARLLPAGHILGAASVQLDIAHAGRRRRLVFSGDIGPDATALLPPPVPPVHADVVLMESTYGDRNHRPREDTLAEIGEILAAAARSGGNLLVPSFAVGRAQELLLLLAEHADAWRMDRWCIFLDSPMAIEATAIHRRHAELARDGTRWLSSGAARRRLRLHEVADASQSMRLNDVRGGALIIAGSGMCTGGRILHHLRHNLPRRECHVMIVGYQSQGSLGRRLVDGAQFVRVYGRDVRVAATIHTVGGLSAHAGQDDLANWYARIGGRPAVHLVHGESRGRDGLAARLQRDHGVIAGKPMPGERIAL